MDFSPLCGGGKIKLGSTPKAVTPFGGLASFIAWLRSAGFYQAASAAMPLRYGSPNAIAPVETFTAFLFATIVGASRFAHCGWLRFDKALHAMLGIARFPGDDAVLRFFGRFGQPLIEAFFRPLWRWLFTLMAAPKEGFTLDLDSTIFNREGSQEGAAKGYNPRRPGRKSHHPLLAVLAEAPLVLHAWLRSGNTAAGRGVIAFLREALALLPQDWRVRCVRADSGFFDQGLLAFLEERGLPYLIVARMTAAIKARLHSAALVWRKVDGDYEVSSFTARLHGWGEARRFIVVRERVRENREAVGRRLLDVPGYTFRVWVTSRHEDPATLWRDYNGRATVEQRIEELKNDLHADGFCTRRFFATEAAFLSVIFAYNLLGLYQAQVTRQSGWRQPATLRAAVFVCGAVLGRAGHRLMLRLSQSGGGLARHKSLILKASEPKQPIAPLLPRTRPPRDDLIPVHLAACAI
jgi:hypothetical protein